MNRAISSSLNVPLARAVLSSLLVASAGLSGCKQSGSPPAASEPAAGGASGAAGGRSGAVAGAGGSRTGESGGAAGSGTSPTAGAGGAAGGAAGGEGSQSPDATTDAPPPPIDTVPGTPDQGAFRIYWIDVEGGAATLLVAPTGETLLADSGWQNTTNRIVSTIEKETGARALDYFLATHYHVDHVSQAPGLAQALTIKNFLDHGPTVENGSDRAYRMAVTQAMSTATRTTVEPGMTFMLGPVEITIVTAARQVASLPTATANPACEGASAPSENPDEDPQSIGFVARYGKFEFVDLGDLTGGVEHRLACPMNQIGQVELFQSSQHGSAESNPVTLLRGLSPQVIVVNNGANKGADAAAMTRFKSLPGLQDLWAVHRKTSNNAAQNADPELIANDQGPDMGHFLRADIKADGTFTVTNGRTMMSRSYTSR